MDTPPIETLDTTKEVFTMKYVSPELPLEKLLHQENATKVEDNPMVGELELYKSGKDGQMFTFKHTGFEEVKKERCYVYELIDF